MTQIISTVRFNSAKLNERHLMGYNGGDKLVRITDYEQDQAKTIVSNQFEINYHLFATN